LNRFGGWLLPLLFEALRKSVSLSNWRMASTASTKVGDCLADSSAFNTQDCQQRILTAGVAAVEKVRNLTIGDRGVVGAPEVVLGADLLEPGSLYSPVTLDRRPRRIESAGVLDPDRHFQYFAAFSKFPVFRHM
jgi:hypothetical protein